MDKKRIMIICFALAASCLSVIVLMFLIRSGAEGVVTTVRSADASTKTVLLAGVDDAGANTDVLLLCHINEEKGSIHLVQIPRDTFYKTEVGSGKINRVYRLNSSKFGKKQAAEKLSKEISEALGIKVDAYAVFDTTLVKSFVDLVGGVAVHVPYEVSYFDGKSGDVRIIPSGECVLGGEEAVAFLRHRKSYAEGDLGRLDAQMCFLSGVFGVLPSLKKIDRILAIYQKILPNLLTNLTEKDIMEVMMAYLKNRNSYSVFLTRLPGEACYVNGAWYYALYRDATESLLQDVFGSVGTFDADCRFTDEKREVLSNIYFSKDTSYRVYTPEEVSKKRILHS